MKRLQTYFAILTAIFAVAGAVVALMAIALFDTGNPLVIVWILLTGGTFVFIISLIIGHSLGDGFYFRYRNGEKPDTDKLIAVMKDAIAEDLPVELVDLTEEEALDYASKHKLKETAELIRTMNRSSFRFAQLGSCLEMYYEPLLPSMKYLKLWELREYEDGLLLCQRVK